MSNWRNCLNRIKSQRDVCEGLPFRRISRNRRERPAAAFQRDPGSPRSTALQQPARPRGGQEQPCLQPRAPLGDGILWGELGARGQQGRGKHHAHGPQVPEPAEGSVVVFRHRRCCCREDGDGLLLLCSASGKGSLGTCYGKRPLNAGRDSQEGFRYTATDRLLKAGWTSLCQEGRTFPVTSSVQRD